MSEFFNLTRESDALTALPKLALKRGSTGARVAYLDGMHLKTLLPGAEIKLTGRTALVTMTLEVELELPDDEPQSHRTPEP